MLAHVIDPAFRFGFDVGVVGVTLQADGGAAVVFGADIEGQVAGFTAIRNQPLGGIEVAFGQPMLFEDVAPAARPDLKIHC